MSSVFSHATFSSPLGTCAIAWSDRGIVSLQLPCMSDDDLRARLSRRAPGSLPGIPPPEVRATIDGVVSLLEGHARGPIEATLDLDGIPPFHQRVYALAREIPPGETVTYGELATRLCAPGAARAVGQAMANNPFLVVVPCHRVLSASGKMGGFSAHGGVATKQRLLALEGSLPCGASLSA